MYYVYVIRSLKDGKNYTGITSDIDRRLREHNSGQTKSSKTRIPFMLIYFEEAADRKLARERESHLKSGIGREFLEQHIPR